MFSVVTFYRYSRIENPDSFRDKLKDYCVENKLCGRILLGKEGINGGVSGSVDDVIKFKEFIQSFFPNLTFREQVVVKNAYKKLVIRVRNEICALGVDVDPKLAGPHVSPQEFRELIENDDVVVLDARNDYEFKVGRFKNAIELNIEKFSDFPRELKKLEPFKNKKIAMYCTGGIRCEKSSALLRQNGFDAVQLEGGIINYVNTMKDDVWQGGLYVFDGRQVSDLSVPIAQCELCGDKSNLMINCHNLDCDRQFVCCEVCQKKSNKTCSIDCKASARQRPKIIERVLLGRVLHYYPKLRVAHVLLASEIKPGVDVVIEGRTTKLKQHIAEFRDDDGKIIPSGLGSVTFVVSGVVRPNDRVYENY